MVTPADPYVQYLLVVLGFFASLIVTIWIIWGFYLMMMPLKRNWKEGKLNTISKIFGYPWLAIFLIMDFTFNITWGTILFLDIPKEFLFTQRLNRYLDQSDRYWRNKLANWMCINFLDSFDPDGHHCEHHK